MNKYLTDAIEEVMMGAALEVRNRGVEIDKLEDASDRVDLIRDIVKSFIEETKL